MSDYSRFRGDLWSLEFNFEHTGALISENDNQLDIFGTFRTKSDLAGLIWYSEDFFKHEYCSYIENTDFTNCKLEFNTSYTGDVAHLDDKALLPALAVTNTAGETRYVTIGFLSSTTTVTETFTPDDLINDGGFKYYELSHPWVKWRSQDIINKAVDEGTDYTVNYVYGIIHLMTAELETGLTITYEYSDFEKYIFDFNNMYTAVHPDHETTVVLPDGTSIQAGSEKINPNGISKLLIPFIPSDWEQGELITEGEHAGDYYYTCYGQNIKEYGVHITNINVTNGSLNPENPDLPAHGYRICEGYDNEFNVAPRRLAREMKKLGYEKTMVLYIGASHFYEKYGIENDKIYWNLNKIYYKQMTLDKTKGLTLAFSKWLDSYVLNLKNNAIDELVISISLENLQMPDEWKQMMANGEPGQTGWTPATSFYSICNEEAKQWIRIVAEECLDILVDHEMPPILQWGEPWWWFQEFVPENVNDDGTLKGEYYPGKPPAFYDTETKNQYFNETGKQLPVYDTTDIDEVDLDFDALSWLKDQIGEYSNFMKGIVKAYDGQYTVLYFPPYILDEDRVPIMMRIVNTPFEYWDKKQLDFIQLEDYDWVITDDPQHYDIYDFGKDELGYDTNKQHYFSGFVMFEKDAAHDWPLIKQAARIARGKGIKEVFLWSGTQIRRDNIYMEDNYQGLAYNLGEFYFLNR